MHEPAGVVEILVQNEGEYPLFWSTVSEYPPNENCHRVQIREFQNTPPKMKIVTESKSESFRIPPQKWKLSQSPNLRVSEYPPPKWNLSQSPNLRVSEYPPQNENCLRVQIWEFQNTPPKWKLSQNPSPRVSEYPPQKKIGKTSDFKLQNSLAIREIYVETNL